MRTTIFHTSWGWMGIATTASGVAAIVLPQRSRHAVERTLQECSRAPGTLQNGADEEAALRHLLAARTTILLYLEGKVRCLDLPLDLAGQPRFRRIVWEVLRKIPYGRVRSYGWVARRVGKPGAARAVGGACGANPVPLVVPCHRVVAADGSLGGFAGGLSLKKRLLSLEGLL